MTTDLYIDDVAALNKTVEVLKKSILDIYNGADNDEGETSLITRQIRFMKKREEENQRKRLLAEYKNKQLEEEVKEQTKTIRMIVDNVKFGFFVINRDFIIQQDATRSCFNLFQTDQLEGRKITDLLGLSPKETENYLAFADQVFEDILPEEVSLAELPTQFSIGETVINLEASAIRDETGDVSHILFSANDISELLKAKEENRNNAILVNILRRKESFLNFLEDSKINIKTVRECISQKDNSAVRRHVHTLKGNAASYELLDIVQTIHVIENSEIIQDNDIDKIENVYRAFLAKNKEILGIEYDEESTKKYEITGAQVEEFTSLVEQIKNRESVEELEVWAKDITKKRVSTLIGPIADFASKLAERLEKEITFTFQGGEELVAPKLMKPIFNNVTHLVRNAIDHGIESKNQRGDKPEAGNLSLEVSVTDTHYKVEVQDDGRGIDANKLLEKAVKQGAISESQASSMSEQDKLYLIFQESLSLADVVTDISGRGMGMPAVQYAVEQASGKIEVETQLGKGTTFRILVPR